MSQQEMNFTGKMCSKCGATPEKLTKVNEKLWCPTCLQTYFIRCSHCRKHKGIEQRCGIRDTGGYGRIVCLDCYKEFYDSCEHCGYGCKKADGRLWEGHSYCNHCYDQMFVCIGCNRRQFRENLYDSGNSGICLCRVCHDEERRIINPQHDARIELNFQGEGPYFYGIELEVEVDEKLQRKPLYAKQILKIFNEGTKTPFAMTKHDGSIMDKNGRNVGFEIVTVPASRIVQYDKWNVFFDNKPKGLRSFDTKTCGLHIHSSRKPLTNLQTAKMLLFINRKENLPFIVTIAGRSPNRYCQIKNKCYANVRHGNNDRYEALNLTNRGTVEWRIFRGTLKRESLFKSLEFCDALIHFCGDCLYSIKDCQRVDKFLEFVKIHKKEYIHLWTFISVRWLREENDLTRKMGFPLPDKPAEIEEYNNEPNPQVREEDRVIEQLNNYDED